MDKRRIPGTLGKSGSQFPHVRNELGWKVLKIPSSPNDLRAGAVSDPYLIRGASDWAIFIAQAAGLNFRLFAKLRPLLGCRRPETYLSFIICC